MKLTKQGIELLHKFEGLRLEAYLCPAKVWTIGYGNTFYEDGSKVKQGDVISLERANELFENIVEEKFAKKVRKLVKSKITDNQFTALVSFTYNVGVYNLKRSTLLRLVNNSPKDSNIAKQFLRWNKAGGRVLLGLTKRRLAEANLYFKN